MFKGLIQREMPIDIKDTVGLIMAGGFGTRMGELTKDLPKPLLKVRGRSIMDHLLERFSNSGVRKVFISTHYKFEKIKEAINEGIYRGLEIKYLYEERPLGTGGCLNLIRERNFKNLLVVNGDVLTDLNLNLLVNFHNKNKSLATLVAKQRRFEVPYGVVSNNFELTEFQEKPTYLNCKMGIYCLDISLLDYFKVMKDLICQNY